MENYKNISVNSSIEFRNTLNEALRNYVHRRVWDDAALLGGFYEEEIDEIIDGTLSEYGNEINHFVAVAIEKVATKYMRDKKIIQY